MPRFVVLEHVFQGIHWDFMLEVGAALRTWAIDLPIEPGLDLPARSLPDHRLAYLDYEGPVSGDRGSVRALARGTYAVRRWSDDSVVVDLEGATFSGTVTLRRAETRTALGSLDSWTFRLGNFS